MSYCTICNRATRIECGGCYDRDVNDLRSTVARLTAENAELDKLARELSDKKADLSRSHASLDRQLTEVKRERDAAVRVVEAARQLRNAEYRWELGEGPAYECRQALDALRAEVDAFDAASGKGST